MIAPTNLTIDGFEPDAFDVGTTVTVRLFDGDALTAERELVVERYETIRPNGALCEPSCRSATLAW